MKIYLLIFVLGFFFGKNQVATFRFPESQTTPSPVEPQDQVLYVLPRSDRQALLLRNITSSFDEMIILWMPDSPEHIEKNKEVHFYVNATIVDEVKSKLKESATTYTILVENTQSLIDQQTYNDTSGQRSTTSYYEQYHALEDIYYWMEQMVESHTNLLEKIYIGSSFEKRPLYVLKAVGFYGTDEYMTNLLKYIDFYILPVMNVDGYQYTWTTNRMWRKNRSKHPNSECYGTDLNRNFDAGWCGPGASRNPCHDTYCGPYPESEPEVAAVANFIRQHKDTIKGYITMHSYSQMVLFPYSYTKEKSKDHDELLRLANKVADGIRVKNRSRYASGAGADTIYLAPGGSDDWVYDLGIKYSFTIELRDKGTYGFLLPPNLIKPTCSEALTGIKIISAHIVKNI